MSRVRRVDRKERLPATAERLGAEDARACLEGGVLGGRDAIDLQVFLVTSSQVKWAFLLTGNETRHRGHEQPNLWETWGAKVKSRDLTMFSFLGLIFLCRSAVPLRPSFLSVPLAAPSLTAPDFEQGWLRRRAA